MPGPVEVLVLSLPHARVDEEVGRALAEVVRHGDVTILDLLFLARQEDGELLVVDMDEQLDRFGLAELDVRGAALISEDDLDVVREALPPDSSAAVLVLEQSWVQRVAAAVAGAGGEVALHVRVPVADVDAATHAATGASSDLA